MKNNFLLEEKCKIWSNTIHFKIGLFVQIVSLDLPGPIGRKLHRKLAINIHNDLVRYKCLLDVYSNISVN